MSKKMGILRTLIVFVLLGGIVIFGAVPPSARAEDEVIRVVETLEDEVHFAGQDEVGTKLTVTVFAYSYDEERRVFYRAEVIVGESGLYDLILPLPVLGSQYVEVEREGISSLTRYERYPKDLSQNLSTYYLNLFEAVRGRK